MPSKELHPATHGSPQMVTFIMVSFPNELGASGPGQISSNCIARWDRKPDPNVFPWN